MSAKELTFFLPKDFNKSLVLTHLVEELGLVIVDIPGNLELGYQFLARRGKGRTILEMEYRDDASAIIEELSEWENPSREYKNALLDCQACINVYYREAFNAREFIMSLSPMLGESSALCIVDNGEGCLLRLADISNCIEKDGDWSWERGEFPELPSVAISEWREME
jgi:hypothetical protein